MLTKVAKGQVIHDQMGLYSTRVKYYVKLTNKQATPLKKIVFTEDAKNFDPRLYMASIEGLYYRGSKINLVSFTIKGYRSDGSSEVVSYDGTKGSTQLNKTTQAEMNEIAKKVQSGEMTSEKAGAVKPEFVKYEISIDPNVELLPGDTLDFNVYLAFKDPYHIPYSDALDIKNVVTADFDYGIPDNIKSLQLSAEANTRFTPLQESLSLAKSTLPGNTAFNPGDRVRFQLTTNMSNLSNARYLDHPVFVDLLPKGLSFDGSTNIKGFYNTSSLIDSYSFEKNYKNTGHDAVVIKFKSGLVSELQGGDANVPNALNIFVNDLIVNKDIIPTKAETTTDNNDNQLYFYFGNEAPDEISSSQKVADTFDLYNGKNIYKATSKVPAIVSDSLSIEKQIRNKNGEWKNEITTDFNEVFDYRLRVKNYFPQKQAALTVYDRLPFADGNGSKFANTLTSPVKAFSGNNDVTDRFDVYYRNDNAPTDPEIAENSASWTTAFMKDATAIKLVLKNGKTVNEYETINIQVEAEAPSKASELYGTSTTNVFHTKYDGASVYAKSNAVQNVLPRRPKTIKVTKKWEDGNNQDGKRPNSIQVQLLADGKKQGDVVELSDANNWTTTWNDLAPEANGKDIIYTVEEVKVPGYSTTVDDTDNENVLITNTHTPETTNVEGQKIWKDTDDQDGKRPEKITVHLLA
ncbi:TPA: Cna B-type domain-containing protein, partial [Enterococcus faecalis]|nr:Cna B-type domain-containing protein [Enterococcus faecalis]